MRWTARLVVAVAALVGGSAVAAAQEPPLDPVAQVGPVAIAEGDFEDWFGHAVHSHYGRPLELVPPGYERCVAVKRRKRATKQWRWLSEPVLRERCARDHRSLRDMTMQFLIQAQWVEQEAARQGLEVSERRVERLFEHQRQTAFANRRDYERFLRESGASEDGIKYRVRLDALQNRLTKLVTERVRPVSKRDVARYRARHPRRFAGMGDARADRRVRLLLRSQREQWALERFIPAFRKRSIAVTWCAAGYAIAECGTVGGEPPVAGGSPE